MGRPWPDGWPNHHFKQYARQEHQYALERYENETKRLYAVLNKRLAGHAFVAGDYSSADMAAYPCIVPHEKQGRRLDDTPHLKRWFESIKARPATQRAYARAAEISKTSIITYNESRKILFSQTGAHLR